MFPFPVSEHQHNRFEDFNNHLPNFGNTLLKMDVFEGILTGSTVLVLFAGDLDLGKNAKINVRRHSQSETFHVDKGALLRLDRESVSTYILTEVAEVEIIVLDLNDDALYLPNQSNEETTLEDETDDENGEDDLEDLLDQSKTTVTIKEHEPMPKAFQYILVENFP